MFVGVQWPGAFPPTEGRSSRSSSLVSGLLTSPTSVSVSLIVDASKSSDKSLKCARISVGDVVVCSALLWGWRPLYAVCSSLPTGQPTAG
jgi:hypothetical protein